MSELQSIAAVESMLVHSISPPGIHHTGLKIPTSEWELVNRELASYLTTLALQSSCCLHLLQMRSQTEPPRAMYTSATLPVVRRLVSNTTIRDEQVAAIGKPSLSYTLSLRRKLVQ
jgi:hypothetical protein